jgi:hypothetical protein
VRRICLLIVLAGLCGCQNPGKKYVQITVENDGKFPAELAGTWVNEEQGWKIVLEKDGFIPTMIIPMGLTEVYPGRETRFEIPKFEGKAIYRPGIWKVHFDPQPRELAITVEIEYFYHDVGNHAVEGSSIDYLSGPVSEDGQTWTPVLQSSGFVDALMFEGWTLKERNNLFDWDEPVWRGELVFQKQDP